MAETGFSRARKYLALRSGTSILSHLMGILAGVLYVGWMILLVLFVELMLHGIEYRPTTDDLEYTARLLGEETVSPGSVFTQDGMLSAVVDARHRPIGPFLEWAFRHWSWTRHSDSFLVGLMISTFLIGVLRMGVLYLQNLFASQSAIHARTSLQKELFTRRYESAQGLIGDEAEDSMTSLLRTHVPNLFKAWVAWLSIPAREISKVISLFIAVLVWNASLGVTFILLALLLWVLGSWTVARVSRVRRQLSTDADLQLGRVLGLSDAIMVLKGYAADAFFRDRIHEHLGAFEQDTMRRDRYESRLHPYWQFSGLLLAIVVVSLAAQNVLTRKFGLAEAAGVWASLLSLIIPVNRLAHAWQEIRRGNKSAQKIFGFLDSKEQHIRDGNGFLPPASDRIEFEKVSCVNSRGKTVLDKLTLRIKAGERVGIVSRSSEEGQAIASLLARFIDPASGKVSFDGTDISTGTIESVRAQVCLINPESLLLPDSVANNIGLGDPSFSLERITEAAKVAHAHQFIQKLPHGYECMVGEGGFPLKVGESYRIALARAILRDPAVVFIEEPREVLDDSTKAALDDTMGRFFPGRTIILLPRRLSTLKSCDEILLFDAGRLIARGTNRELLESSELYRHLQYTTFHHPTPSTD